MARQFLRGHFTGIARDMNSNGSVFNRKYRGRHKPSARASEFGAYSPHFLSPTLRTTFQLFGIYVDCHASHDAINADHYAQLSILANNDSLHPRKGTCANPCAITNLQLRMRINLPEAQSRPE